MARLSIEHISDAHLLCLMEVWFDRTQELVQSMAACDYVVCADAHLECLFCGQHYGPRSAAKITRGRATFQHDTDCPVLKARQLRAEMIEGEDDEWDEDD